MQGKAGVGYRATGGHGGSADHGELAGCKQRFRRCIARQLWYHVEAYMPGDYDISRGCHEGFLPLNAEWYNMGAGELRIRNYEL
jgi:hypothetical protein